LYLDFGVEEAVVAAFQWKNPTNSQKCAIGDFTVETHGQIQHVRLVGRILELDWPAGYDSSHTVGVLKRSGVVKLDNRCQASHVLGTRVVKKPDTK
jgi:hypothetical protein